MDLEENEANKANYDEIRGHIDIIKAKLASAPKSDNLHEHLVENLNDHYDRMLQLRIYRNQTLEEQLREQNAAMKELSGEFRRVNTQRIGLILMALLAIVFVAFEVVQPGFVANTVKNVPIWGVFSHATAAVVAFLAFRPRAA